MGELAQQPNIGPKVEQQLNEVSIFTLDELRAVGSREAWLRILARAPSACIHRLYSLEGAIRGIRKAELPQDVKDALKAFMKQSTGKQ